MSGPLLLIGRPVNAAREVLETVLLIGYRPIFVHAGEGLVAEEFEQYSWDTLPNKLKNLPAFLAGEVVTAELRSLRFDRRWVLAKRNTIGNAVAQGVSNWITIAHPSSDVSPSAAIGRGVFIGPQASVSSGATVGDFAVVGRNSSLGHDSILGDFSRLGPGAVVPGEVSIGANVIIGPAATVINGIRIGDGVLVGAGSVVTRHIRQPLQVMGNPARPLRRPLSVIRRGIKRFARRVLRQTGLYERVREVYRRGFG